MATVTKKTIIDEQFKEVEEKLIDKFKHDLQSVEEEIISEALEQIPPKFISTYINKDYLHYQKDILIDVSRSDSLRKQAFQKINLLSKKDIRLIHILEMFKDIIVKLNWNNIKRVTEMMILDEEIDELVPFEVEQLVFILKDEIHELKKAIKSFITKYDVIKYSDFQNLFINRLVMNDGRHKSPMLSLMLKSFIDYSIDTSKNKEYYADKYRSTKNFKMWSEWFTEEHYEGIPEILKVIEELKEVVHLIPQLPYYRNDNKNCDFYWVLSDVGEYISKITKK